MYFFVYFFFKWEKVNRGTRPWFVFVEYNGNNQVKKQQQQNKVSKYIFFLSNTFQCDLW